MSRIANAAILFGLVPVSACVDYPESVTDEDVLDQLVECQTSVGLLEENVGELSAAVEALQANDELQDGLLDEHDAELAEHDAELAQAVLLLTSSTTVSVSDADGLVAALDALDRYRLARDVTYTIELEDGTYEFSSPLKVDHPDGAALEIIGNVTSPDAVTLTFEADVDGIVVEDGAALGLLAGVTVRAINTTSGQPTGILARNGGSLSLGDSVRVEDFYSGVVADGGATISDEPTGQTEGWLTVEGCVLCVYATGASHISVPYAVAYPNSGSAGLMATNGSHINADNAMVDGGYQGFIVTNGSSMVAEYATAIGQDAGISATGVSYLNASGSVTTGSRLGSQVESYSYLDILNGTVEGTVSSVWQGTMGAVNVTGGSIPNGVGNHDNDITDFVIGN